MGAGHYKLLFVSIVQLLSTDVIWQRRSRVVTKQLVFLLVACK